MKPLLLKTQHAEYVKSTWSGANTSGVDPIGDRVLILADKASDQTSGQVFLTQESTERHSMAAQSGVLIAVGEDAWLWNSDRTRPYQGRKPSVGERVIFEKYAGQLVLGDDGDMYRLMDDKCVAGIST